MDKNIQVSAVITNYNYSKYLNRAIRSVFVQNFPQDDFEIIIVDDCSTDWSREIIASYGSFVRPFYLKQNNGLAFARNHGISSARGKYIVFVDADDYINRNMIFVQWFFLTQNPSWDAVAVDYDLVGENEEIITRVSHEDEPIACGIMYKKERLLEIGMFDQNFRMHEDKDFRIRFLKKYKIHRIELPLYRYRMHDMNMTLNKEMNEIYSKRLSDKHMNS